MTQEERFKEALEFDKNGQYGKSIPLLQALADEGYVKAQSLLGYYHVYSIGVSGDYAEAAELFGKAAMRGDESARKWLGQIKAWEASANIKKACPKCGADASKCPVNFGSGSHYITCPKCGNQFGICPECGAITKHFDDGLYFVDECPNCAYEDRHYVGSSEGRPWDF